MAKDALVVDDTEFSRLTISTFLNLSGFNVDVAENGMVGLKNLSSKKYDLIFSDVEMPNMNGFEFLKRIKTNNLYKHIPVVMLTSLNDDETVSKLKVLGATFYICKPFSREKMKSALAATGF